MDSNIKGHGYLRKTKLGLASGIILGAVAMFGLGSVSADETIQPKNTENTPTATTSTTAPNSTTTSTTAPNSTTTSTTAPKSATPSTSVVAEKGKEIVVDNGLTKVAEEVKANGVEPVKEETKNIGTAKTNSELEDLKKKADAEIEAQKKALKDEEAKNVEANKEILKNREELKSRLSNPSVYESIANNLNNKEDKDYRAGHVKITTITSSKGKVSYVNLPEEVEFNLTDDGRSGRQTMMTTGITETPKNVVYSAKRSDGSFINLGIDGSSTTSQKGVPVYLQKGESLTYRTEYTSESEMFKDLGVKYIDTKMTLESVGTDDTSVNHVLAMLTPAGSSQVSGGVFFYVQEGGGLNSKPFTTVTTKNYYDKDGKKIDSKVLASTLLNRGLLKKGDVSTPDMFSDNSYTVDLTSRLKKDPLISSESATSDYNKGGDFSAKRYEITVIPGSSSYAGFMTLHLIAQGEGLDSEKYTLKKGDKVPYHLVSYTDNRNADIDPNNPATPKVKGSVVQKFVSDKGIELAKSTSTGEKPEGEALTLTHPNELTYEGKTYVFVKQDKETPNKIVKGEVVVTYTYKEKEEVKGSVTQKFVDDKGKEIANVVKTGDKPEGSDLNLTHPKEITFQGKTYIFVSQDKPDPKKITKGETVVTYTYKENEQPKPEVKGSVVQKFVDTKGVEIKERTNTGEQKEGSSVSLSHPTEITFQGKTYTFVSQDKPDPSKVVKGEVVVTYTYKEKEQPKPETPKPETPKPTPTVEPTTIFVDEDGKEVAPKEKGTQPPKTVEGYTYNPQHPKNKEDKNGETVRVYKKVQKGGVVQHFVSEEGSKIAESKSTLNLEVGSKLELKHPTEITHDGKTYVFVKQDKETPTEISEGIVEVTYTYKLKETPTLTPTPTVESTTIFVDEEGKEISPKEKGTQPPKAIEGYEYDSTNPKNKEDKDGETVRVYKKVKVGTVIQRFVDEQGKELQPSVNSGRLKLGSKLDSTFPKELTVGKDKYTFKSQDKDTPKEVTSEGELVITYVYAKEVAPVVPTETPSKPSTIVPDAKPSVSGSNGAVNTPTTNVNKAELPNTGSSDSVSAAIAGVGLLTLVALSGRRSKED